MRVLIIIVVLLVAIFFLRSPKPFLPIEPLPNKILDMHCHGAGIGFGSDCFVSEKMKSSFKFRFYMKYFNASLEEVEEFGDQIIIERLSKSIEESKYVDAAIVLALDGIIDEDGNLDKKNTDLYVSNEFILKETSKYPNLFFGASINPHRKNALELLERAKADGAKLIKWLPSVQLIDPSDEKLIPFYKKMKELNLPLLVHTGKEESFTFSTPKFEDPKRLKLPLDIGVMVIAAHAAAGGKNEGQKNIDRLIDILDKYPNLYVDISSLTQLNRLGYLKKVLQEKGFEGKIFYGTDFPIINSIFTYPWNFIGNLTLKQVFELSMIKNPWDRNVMLKHSLGTPTQAFANGFEMLIQ